MMSLLYKLITLILNITYNMVYNKKGINPTRNKKKIENCQVRLNKIRKLLREQTLIVSTHSPIEIRTDHGNKTSIYILNIYLFLTLVS